MSKIMISELAETTTAPDESYIAIDNGSATNKITIANYNANANHTAKRYADAAEGYADNAIAARDSAISAKNECETLVNSASNFANAASTNASAAAGSASEASGYVGSAQASASNALASARAADNSAADAAIQVLQSKSWAQGNTGVRAGENTNNAKYWSEVARGAAGGGVSTFNGRFGAVVSESGDYSSDQIAHVNSDSTYTNVETALNEAQANIANKLNYYSSAPTQWDTAPTANSTKPVTSAGILAAITEAINSIPKSYVGMIIHSTKFDTEAKVKAFYGGTKWIRHSGYVLRGATSGVVANSATKTGGNDNAVVIDHNHNVRVRLLNGGSEGEYGIPGVLSTTIKGGEFTQAGGVTNLSTSQPVSVLNTGEAGTNKNIPNYKSVYIWERTQ